MHNRAQGAVLIFTLWATAVLATVGLAQSSRISLQTRYAARMQDREQAWFLAESAVQTAAGLLADDDPTWDGWKEPWGEEPGDPLPFGPGTLHYRVQDEQAFLPLNALTADLLVRLPGFSGSSSQAFLARRMEGKEITHLGELRKIPGYDADALDELIPLVTAHGHGPVNLNTAGRAVCEKLGLAAPFVSAVERFRAGPDGTAGTEDDGVFERANPQEISSRILESTGYRLTPEDADLLNGLLQGQKPMLGVASKLFRVAAEGRVARSGARARVEAVVDRTGTIRGWHES